MEYHVTWEIEVDADNPIEAAREALKIQRDPESTATVFKVRKFNRMSSIEIDLNKGEII